MRNLIPALSLSAVILIAAGCGFFATEPQLQWFKPSTPYTEEEYKRDKAACTSSRKLDLDCMKAKGWVYFSADTPPSITPPSSSGSQVPVPGKR